MKKLSFAFILALAVALTATAQTGSVNTSGIGTSGVYVETTSSSFPDVGVEVIDSFRVFNSSNQELLRIHPDGKSTLGIGTFTTSAVERLHVLDNADRNSLVVMENPNTGTGVAAGFRAKADTAFGSFHAHASTRTLSRYNQVLGGWMEILHVNGSGLAIGTITSAPIILGTNNVDRLHIAADGKVGVGTPTPANNLHVVIADGAQNVPLKMETTGADSITGISLKNDARNWHVRVDGTDLDKFKVYDANANAYRMTVDASGNVGIGTTAPTAKLEVAGDIVASGNIAAKYQDVAEWVPSAERLAAGTVVIVAPGKSNEVVSSSQPYDTRVAGVISAQPGLILGEAGASKVMVATTGRVRVRVDASAGPIEAGDILVTGTKPGTAMKSSAVDIVGVKLHRPGTVVGKALEPLARGEGEILVLLSLQ